MLLFSPNTLVFWSKNLKIKTNKTRTFPEANIWAQKGWALGMEKASQWGTSKLCHWLPHCSRDQRVWLLTMRSRVQFPAIPQFLLWIRSGTRSTQPHADHWEALKGKGLGKWNINIPIHVVFLVQPLPARWLALWCVAAEAGEPSFILRLHRERNHQESRKCLVELYTMGLHRHDRTNMMHTHPVAQPLPESTIIHTHTLTLLYKL